MAWNFSNWECRVSTEQAVVPSAGPGWTFPALQHSALEGTEHPCSLPGCWEALLASSCHSLTYLGLEHLIT